MGVTGGQRFLWASSLCIDYHRQKRAPLSLEESTEFVSLIEMHKHQLDLEGRVTPEIGMGLCCWFLWTIFFRALLKKQEFSGKPGPVELDWQKNAVNSVNGDKHFWSLSNNFISALHLEVEVLFIFRMLLVLVASKDKSHLGFAVGVSSNITFFWSKHWFPIPSLLPSSVSSCRWTDMKTNTGLIQGNPRKV